MTIRFIYLHYTFV